MMMIMSFEDILKMVENATLAAKRMYWQDEILDAATKIYMKQIEEAIKHCEKFAEEQVRIYRLCPSEYDCNGLSDCKVLADGRNKGCLKRADENRQLAEWLKELKKYLEKQISQKPKYISDGYSDGELVYDMAKCPNCGNDEN